MFLINVKEFIYYNYTLISIILLVYIRELREGVKARIMKIYLIILRTITKGRLLWNTQAFYLKKQKGLPRLL